MVLSFEDFMAYDTNSGQLYPRMKDTRITVGSHDVTLALAADVKFSHGETPDNRLPVYVDVGLTALTSESFVDSYDVYLVDGKNPKAGSGILIGNVKADPQAGASYTLPRFTTYLTAPDGKDWWQLEEGTPIVHDYAIHIVAHYKNPDAAPGMRTAALADSHHGATATYDFTVTGVGSHTVAAIDMAPTPAGFIINAPSDIPVAVYSASGTQVAAGVANTEIQLPASGIYMIKAGNKVFKLAR